MIKKTPEAAPDDFHQSLTNRPSGSWSEIRIALS
jgi:hypothetical protein